MKFVTREMEVDAYQFDEEAIIDDVEFYGVSRTICVCGKGMSEHGILFHRKPDNYGVIEKQEIICPGDWVVSWPDGRKELVKAADFDKVFKVKKEKKDK